MESTDPCVPKSDDIATLVPESVSKDTTATKKRKAVTASTGAENANPQLDNSNRVSRSKSAETVDSAASAEDVKDSSVPTKGPSGIKKPVSKMPRSKRAVAN